MGREWHCTSHRWQRTLQRFTWMPSQLFRPFAWQIDGWYWILPCTELLRACLFKGIRTAGPQWGNTNNASIKKPTWAMTFFLRVFSTIYCCRRSIYIIWCHPVVSHRQRLRIARHSRLQPSTLSWGGQSIFGTSWTLLNRGWLKLLALHVNALDTFGYHFTGIYEGNG